MDEKMFEQYSNKLSSAYSTNDTFICRMGKDHAGNYLAVELVAVFPASFFSKTTYQFDSDNIFLNESHTTSTDWVLFEEISDEINAMVQTGWSFA